MPPAEVAHLVKSLEVECSRHGVTFGELAYTRFLSAITHSFEKLAVIARSILAEIFKNVREWSLWHLDLQEIVAHRNHAVVSSRLSTEGQWLLTDTFVDDTIGEHGLRRDAEDEGPEAGVAIWFAAFPHG